MSLGKIGPATTEHGRGEAPVEDDDAILKLSQILTEMKIMNLHLAKMSDEKISKQDVE